jgi:hypothetical protein
MHVEAVWAPAKRIKGVAKELPRKLRIATDGSSQHLHRDAGHLHALGIPQPVPGRMEKGLRRGSLKREALGVTWE